MNLRQEEMEPRQLEMILGGTGWSSLVIDLGSVVVVKSPKGFNLKQLNCCWQD